MCFTFPLHCTTLLSVSSLPPPLLHLTRRFGVSQTSTGSSRSSLENGGRERDRSSGSDDDDEDDSSQQNASDAGRVTGYGRVSHGLTSHEGKKTWRVSECLHLVFPLPGPGWTADFRDSKGTASQTPAGWDSSLEGAAEVQATGWANFTEFQPFSGWVSG